MTKITFLGTSGGRFATIHQTRATGGIFIEDSINISLDPGPGAIVRMNEIKIDPTTIDLLLVSHSHPDHYTDSDIIVEAITRGGTEKRGAIIGPESVITGTPGFSPKVSNYHLSRLEKIIVLKPYDTVDYEQLKITATPTQHTDPYGIGFKFHLKDGTVTYTGDTSLTNDIMESYSKTRLLIMAMTTPMGFKLHHHLSPEEAVVVLKKVKPEMTILTHFGIKVINAGAEKVAQWINDSSGVHTIAAEDKMVVELADEIKIQKH